MFLVNSRSQFVDQTIELFAKETSHKNDMSCVITKKCIKEKRYPSVAIMLENDIIFYNKLNNYHKINKLNV